MSLTLLDLTERLVAISDFSQGKAGKIFSDVAENNVEYMVLKNNQPIAVLLSVEEYRDIKQKAEKYEKLMTEQGAAVQENVGKKPDVEGGKRMEKRKQSEILRDIFVESFEMEPAGMHQFTQLFEVTSIEGVEIPKGLKILINFDNRAKVRMCSVPWVDGGYSEAEDDYRFMGNLNIWVMKGKKVLNYVHKPHNGPEYAARENTVSFKDIIEPAIEKLR